MGRIKVFFSILVVILIQVFSTKPVFAWKFAVMGDTRPGTSYDHSQNAYGVSLKTPNSTRVTVFENGDLTLDGTDSQWANYRSIISTPLGIPTDNSGWLNSFGIPKIISSVGNHDTHQSGWQTRWQTYLPAQAGLTAYSDIPANPQGLYGSVKYQNAIFVWVDYYSMPSGQEAFLRDTLIRAKNDPQVVWKFVSYHSPAVSCGGSHSDWTQGKVWHDNYFYPNGVDLVFTGDNHYYERDCPFRSGLAASGSNEQSVCDTNNMGNIINNTDGVIHIVSGGGGAELYSVGNCPYLAKNQNGQNAAFSLHQFIDIEINGNTLHAIVYDTDTGVGTNPVLTSANFQVIDDFTINKTTGPTPTPGGPTQTPPPPTSTPRPTTVPPTPTPSQTNALLVRTINTSVLNPAMPDPAGITYLPSSGRLLVSDSEVDEMPIYANKNLYELSLTGVLAATGNTNTLAYSHEPTGVSYNSDDNVLYISDDDQQRVFTVRPGSDGIFGTVDDTSSYFSTSSFGATDPESVVYANISGTKYLFIADGANHYVYQTTLTGTLVNKFDVGPMGLSDIEGITYYRNTGTLFILEGTGSRKIIVETTIQGLPLRTINLVSSLNPGFNPILPSDLVFAPSSDPNDSPSIYNLYITDRGVDNDTNPNENDGKIYEMSLGGLSSPTPTSGNPSPTPPVGCFNSIPVYGQLPTGTVAACTQSLEFSWNDDPIVDHYALRIDEDPISWSGNCSTVNPGDTCIDYLYGNSYTRVVTPGKTYRWWVEAYIPCGVPIPTPAPTNVPTTGPSPTAIPTTPPITPPVGGRVLKYYGVDRGNPISDANYSLLSQHAVKTIIVATDVHGSSSSWQSIMNLAATYNFSVVIWPEDYTHPVPNCGWASPYISLNGDFIARVKPLLDAIGGNPRFIGIVNAHEPMWSCITTVKDMETIKNQLKAYIQTKFGRTDFKVWNYIDNVTDIRYLPDYSGPADIARVMDVAATWQHCFGGAEGTCPQAQQKIVNDRAAITNAGLEGRVELVYLFQTFAMGGGYRMPTETEMHDWSCNFLNTKALDGFLYYTWGACWYSSDLYCPATTHPYQNLWPIMNNVYNECVVK